MLLTSEDAAVVIHVIRVYLVPAILGAAPRNLHDIHCSMDATTSGWNVPKAAVDMACYDLLDKSGGLRVAELLGDAARSTLPIMWTVGMDTPEANAEKTVAKRMEGLTSLMIKVAADMVEEDARRVRAVREAVGPDYPLIADANQGWNVRGPCASPVLWRIATLPCMNNPSRRRHRRARGGAPQKRPAHLSGRIRAHIGAGQTAHRKKAADVFSIKVVKHGGIRKAHEIINYAEAQGILCLMNSNAAEGVTQAARLQLEAAAANLWPYGYVYRSSLHLAADISTFSEYIRDGWVSLPEGPGLGMDLRPEIRERFLIRRHAPA